MNDTKEKILTESLELFAQKGYDAVSVRDIAEQLGITKGALYKHYASKRDIFDHILRRMEANDEQRALEYEVPEGELAEMSEKYQNAELAKITIYTVAQFRYWVEDEIAAPFRKMLTLEQYKSKEMSDLYQNYLAAGPVAYMEDLFGSMIPPNTKELDPRHLALEFYAPVYMLMSIYDGSAEQEKSAIMQQVQEHVDRFADRFAERTQGKI